MCGKYFLVSQDVIHTYTVISHMLHGSQGKEDDEEDGLTSPYGFSDMAVISIVFTVAVTAVTMVFLLARLAVYHFKHQPPAYERVVPSRAVR